MNVHLLGTDSRPVQVYANTNTYTQTTSCSQTKTQPHMVRTPSKTCRIQTRTHEMPSQTHRGTSAHTHTEREMKWPIPVQCPSFTSQSFLEHLLCARPWEHRCLLAGASGSMGMTDTKQISPQPASPKAQWNTHVSRDAHASYTPSQGCSP